MTILGSAFSWSRRSRYAAQRVDLRPVADRIEARYPGRVSRNRARVVVAPRAQVQLLRPALLRVQTAEEQHHVRRRTARALRGVAACPLRALSKIAGRFVLGAETARRRGSGRDRRAAPPIWWKKSCRCRSASRKSAKRAISRIAAAASRSTQGLNTSGRCTLSALSGRKAGKTCVPRPRGRDRLVARQVVGRIVGGADRLHVELAQDAVRAQFVRGQQRVGLLPDARGAALVQQFVDAEVALQLQVRPVVERIAQRVRHGARPGQELLVRRRRRRCNSASSTPLARMARHL